MGLAGPPPHFKLQLRGYLLKTLYGIGIGNSYMSVLIESLRGGGEASPFSFLKILEKSYL